MPMNEDVRKAVEAADAAAQLAHDDSVGVAQWQTIRAELTRLTEIAESVDPLVVRLGEVTTRLEAANALLREAIEWNWLDDDAPGTAGVNTDNPSVLDELYMNIQAHLSEPRT